MKTVEILKQIQADGIVFFMKTHNLHWNVKGLDFMQVHKATEEIYEQFATIFDDVAEKILQLEQKPLVTLSDCLKVTKLKEETKSDFKSKEVVTMLLSDFEYFLKLFTDLSKQADADNHSSIANYADDMISNFEKSIWIFKSQLA